MCHKYLYCPPIRKTICQIILDTGHWISLFLIKREREREKKLKNEEEKEKFPAVPQLGWTMQKYSAWKIIEIYRNYSSLWSE